MTTMPSLNGPSHGVSSVPQVCIEGYQHQVLYNRSKFLAQLDKYTANLQKVFSSKGGASRQKISRIMSVADNMCVVTYTSNEIVSSRVYVFTSMRTLQQSSKNSRTATMKKQKKEFLRPLKKKFL